MEKEILNSGPVLDKEGRPIPGFSRRSTLRYDRTAIKALPWRIKEWDFYQVSNDRLCLQFTIGHASYAGQVSLMLFDFAEGVKLLDLNKILPLPFHSLHMPWNGEEEHHLLYNKGGVYMEFEAKGDKRRLRCAWGDVRADICMKRRNPDSLVINVPFDENEHAFYYNQKINCMAAKGYVRKGNKRWRFEKENSFGLLDWGRGVWPFHNEWYWSNGTGYLDGKMFGFNLGCGFGNTDMASENMLFYKGKSHKLGKVDFVLGGDYMQHWHIKDREGRLDLTLTPTYDRTTAVKLLWVDNCCHQMFGSFCGKAVLDDGTELEVKDAIYLFSFIYTLARF